MPSATVVLSLVAVGAYVALCYLNGRIALRLITDDASPVMVAGAPLLGGALLGVQLWAYSAVAAPWNPVTLVAPWLFAWVLARRRLRSALENDWSTFRRGLEALRAADRLALILGALTALLIVTYLLNLVTQPLTGFDAISMWFFKARFFFTTHSVDPGAIPGLATTWPADPGPYRIDAGAIRNVDYPPLYSLMVATMYALTGGIHDTLGKGVDIVFVLSGAAVVWTALAPAAGHGKAALFAFLVTAIGAVQSGLGNPLYTGYADYPIAIAMLLALANLYEAASSGSRASWTIAIVFASIAALLKVEGLPFLLVVVLVAALKQWRAIVAPASVIAVAPVAAWRVIVAAHGWHSAHLLNDSLMSLPALLPGRALLILVYIVEVVAHRPEYLFLSVALVFSAWLALSRRRAGERPVLLVICAQLLAYFGVLVLNPGELAGTLDRLVIQIAPPVVLLLGLVTIPESDEAPQALPLRVELVGE